MRLSIIIPVLNEASTLPSLLQRLQTLRQQGHEIIVVDGGSEDATVEISEHHADLILNSRRGRAIQMNCGAAAAGGDVFWFVHADTCLPAHCDDRIQKALNGRTEAWGRFDVCLSGRRFMFEIISLCMNLRSRLTGVATGDQAIFVTRALFENVNGYPPISLMEDIALSKRLRRQAFPCCLKTKVVTSSRRWEQHGIVKTVVLMWWLRLRYFCGADPDKLAKVYH